MLLSHSAWDAQEATHTASSQWRETWLLIMTHAKSKCLARPGVVAYTQEMEAGGSQI